MQRPDAERSHSRPANYSCFRDYLTGTGSPVEMRLELNEKRFQITFKGIALGAAATTAADTEVAPDYKRSIMGVWDTALGVPFWKHDPNSAWANTWSAFSKSIFTASTGAANATGGTPAPMDLRYVIASDPGVPDPLPPGPTGFTATALFGKLELKWNALAGATGYVVKRSIAPSGPFSTVLANVAGTTYSAATAAPEAFYYYTVSANLASGSTADVTALGAGLAATLVRNTGGTANASTENPPNNTAAKAFDGLASTKWNNVGGTVGWLQYRFPSGKQWAIQQYKMTNASDVPARDPKDWQVLGSNDGVTWIPVDTPPSRKPRRAGIPRKPVLRPMAHRPSSPYRRTSPWQPPDYHEQWSASLPPQ